MMAGTPIKLKAGGWSNTPLVVIHLGTLGPNGGGLALGDGPPPGNGPALGAGSALGDGPALWWHKWKPIIKIGSVAAVAGFILYAIFTDKIELTFGLTSQ